MKKCPICGKKLGSSLDEFGEDFFNPTCQSCFLAGIESRNKEMEAILDEIAELEEANASLENDIDFAEDEIRDWEKALAENERALTTLRLKLGTIKGEEYGHRESIK